VKQQRPQFDHRRFATAAAAVAFAAQYESRFALALEHWIEHQRKSIKSQFTWVVTEEIGVYCHGQKRRRGENFASIMRIEPRTVIISGSVSGLKFRNLVEVEKLLTNLVENLIVKFGQRTAILFCSGRARTVCVD